MNDYYVYLYWRLDTNEPFYVGKGKRYRWCQLSNRNKHFNNIINKYPIVCEIVKDNLTEEEAHGIECWIINELVFEYGYSIDIKGADSTDHYCHLVNQTWGGEGMSGCYSLRNKTDDELKEIYKKHSETLKKKGNLKGKNHPMYGKRGENSPLYGKCHSEETKKKQSQSMKGKNAKFIICITTGEIFATLTEGGDFYRCDKGNISLCCKNKRNSAGKLEDGTPLVWMYLEDYEKVTKKEIQEKINNANKLKIHPNSKPTICITTKKIFPSVRCASEFYKCDSSNIADCCRGRVKSAGKSPDRTKLVWRYLNWNHNKRFRFKEW